MGHVVPFEHTADLGLRIEADDLEDLFETAALGLFQTIVVEVESVRSMERREVTLESDTTAGLLVRWLNELIFLSETGHSLFCRFQVKIDETGLTLSAVIEGEPIDPTRHVLDHEVKAATLHGLSLVEEHGHWLAEVIVDI